MPPKKLIVLMLLAMTLSVLLMWFLGKRKPPESFAPPTKQPNTQVSRPTHEASVGHLVATPTAAPAPVAYDQDPSARFGKLTGQVQSRATKRGIANAEITFVHDGVAISIISQNTGGFQFTPNAPGRYEIAAVTAEAHMPFAPAWGQSPISFTARPFERIDNIIVYLTPSRRYAGQVLDPEDHPVPQATVHLLPQSNSEQILIDIQTEFVTDQTGSFTFAAPDQSWLEAEHPDFSNGRARLDLKAQIAGRLIIRMQPKNTVPTQYHSIGGTVLLPDGSPAEGAIIKTSAAHHGSRSSTTALSAVDGRFHLVGLSDKRYTVVATHRSYAPAIQKNVSAGTKNLILSLADGLSIEGVVTFARTGTPVSAFSVWVGEQIEPMKTISKTAKTVYDSTGFYRVEGLHPGRYTVMVSAEGSATQRRSDVILTAQSDEPLRVDFQLRMGATVVGHVIDQISQSPIDGAKVSVEGTRQDGPSVVFVRPASWTKRDGSFVIKGLSPQSTSFTVAAEGYHAKIMPAIEIRDATTYGPIRIELTPLAPDEEPKLELAGIGAVLEPSGESLLIRQVIANGGAARANLEPGDRIEKIDGVAVTQMGFQGSIKKIRGPIDTIVFLTIVKKETPSRVEVPVTRYKIRV